MIRVDLYGCRIVLDCVLEIPLFPEGEPSVVVEVSLARFQLYRLREAFDSLFEIAFPVQADAFVVIREGVVRVDLYRERVVLDSEVEFPDLIVSKSSVKESFEVARHDFEGFAVEFNGFFVVALLPSSVTLRMVDLGLLFLLLGVWTCNCIVKSLVMRRSLRNAHGEVLLLEIY